MIELAIRKKPIRGFKIYLVPTSNNKITNKNHKTKKTKIKKNISKAERPTELEKYSTNLKKIV